MSAPETPGSLAGQGVDAEVVDLRTIAPIDEDTVLTSVRKTGRLVVVSEAIKRGSSVNDVVARVAEQTFDALKAPIARVAPPAIRERVEPIQLNQKDGRLHGVQPEVPPDSFMDVSLRFAMNAKLSCDGTQTLVVSKNHAAFTEAAEILRRIK